MILQINGRAAFVATGEREIRTSASTIVFVHGTGQDHTIWRPIKRYFVRVGWNVLDLDLPGHGRSAGPGMGSIESMADWVVKVLDELQIDSVSLVGHSMGSLVAFDIAARNPHRVTRLAMVSTAFPMAVSDPLMDAAAAYESSAIEMLTLWGLSPNHQLFGRREGSQVGVAACRRLFERADPVVIHTDLEACHKYESGYSLAMHIDCSSLFLLAGARHHDSNSLRT